MDQLKWKKISGDQLHAPDRFNYDTVMIRFTLREVHFIKGGIKLVKKNDCSKFHVFIQENQDFLNNPVIKDFLSNKSNYNLLRQSICNPTYHNKEELDRAFRGFYFNIRFTAYISSTIYYHAINLDKKMRLLNYRFPTTLDQPVKEESDISIKDMTIYHEDFELKSDNILDYITDSNIYKAVKRLTPNQRNILYLVYIKGLTDSETAQYLKKSQQTISKSRNKALKRIRKELNISPENCIF
ncbi:sigma-70 family RNA polymerase sigma factor [uncultured Rummeliibacillus sp.]|uniref:sigma-70 family RNA polymerase sigma factor n=1 Tax=uncultured Rummeliibacillus sp. TaxID=762292 RepID=UPI000E665E5F|nr:sigma-70 family RNA polymerase sigma factor [uncultured Rummeliibacillus sp.]RIJ62960.1 sigma-70 family RNA polymerase sigma factor [Rummeliibacillus sp. POC4]RPJ95601.1 sigma-70 family RNA polymerase sigma factor [Rummeliibacillus sp. TYF005]